MEEDWPYRREKRNGTSGSLHQGALQLLSVLDFCPSPLVSTSGIDDVDKYGSACDIDAQTRRIEMRET